MSLGSFKNIINSVFTNHLYFLYRYQEDLALNNL